MIFMGSNMLFAFSALHSKMCLSEKRQSHISCICLTFLHCAFSNVSANGLDGKRYSHIGCICLTFLLCFNEMQTMWLRLFSCRAFKETFKNAQWRKVKQMRPMQCDHASYYAHHLKTHLKTHSGEKSNKCNQCDYASSSASHLRTQSINLYSSKQPLKIF